MCHGLVCSSPTPQRTSVLQKKTIGLLAGLCFAAAAAGQGIPGGLPAVASPTTFAGPMTITHGGTYTGNWQSRDPKVPAVDIRTSEPVVILNSRVRGPGDLIRADTPDKERGTSLTVKNTSGFGTYTNTAGAARGRFINDSSVNTLDVEHCLLISTIGISAYAGGRQARSIKVLYNKSRNIDGRVSDGAGGYRTGNTAGTDFEFSQFLQLNQVRNIPVADIGWNESINTPGQCRVEDNINLYLSSGTPSSPIRIHDNYIQGAYGAVPGGDGYTGGGIMLGDGGTKNPADAPGFARADHNQVVSTGNYGVSIAGGHDQQIDHNRVVSSGRLPGGASIITPKYANGITGWNCYAEPATVFFGNTVRNNVSGLIRPDGRSDWWTPGAKDTNNVHFSPPGPGAPTLADESAEYRHWLQKIKAAHVTLGPQP